MGDTTLSYTYEEDFFIDGEYVAAHSPSRLVLTNPATELEWGAVPLADEVDLDRAVEAAHRAFQGSGWRDLAASERAGYLLRMADELEARAEALAHMITSENGTPISETRLAARVSASMLRYFASLASEVDKVEVRPYLDKSGDSIVRRDPVGVCALIAPWNYPINLVMGKLAPALISGCTVVIKPSSTSPLSIRLIADSAKAAGIPNGVVNIITGSGSFGDKLVTHRLVNKVAFTGSTEVGRHIATLCGQLLRPVTLELGGKSSAIVLPDVDVDVMRSSLIRSCLRNTGQTCFISTRLLVPASRYDEIVGAVTETIESTMQGDPLADATVFGPSATAAQRDTVRDFIRVGLAGGARATTGGDVASGFERGYFVKPTVFADVDPGSTIAQAEIFGPVLTITRYDTVDSAVEIANNTDFGLGGVVFSSDPENALRVAARVDTGSIGINFYQPNHTAPFGGRRQSGLGVEFGPEGLAAYLKPQSIHRPSR